MKLLAFETATEACSVALSIDGQIIERFALAPRRHAELALPWAEELLAEAGIARAQLDAIAVGRGPGAFTGVRLAIAIGQGIALALDRPVIAISTLAALAQRSSASCTLAAIDARMGEVYIGAFAGVGLAQRLLSPEALLRPDHAAVPEAGDWFGVGTGFSASDGALVQRAGSRLKGFDASALPHAADVARLAEIAFLRGDVLAPDQLEPAYLRNDVALTLVQQQASRSAR